MNIEELASSVAKEGSPFSTRYQSYKYMFMRGYEAATTWLPMDTAPKDGTRILISENGIVCIGFWSERWGNTWVDGAAFGSQFKNPDGWLPLPKAKQKS